MTATVDHLVYACPELEPEVERIAELAGVRPAYGGQHAGLGTHNALLALGTRTYLEIIAPDPAQPHPAEPLWFGLDEIAGPELRAWAAAVDDLDAALRHSRAAGFGYGPVAAGHRSAPDGREFRWRRTSTPMRATVAVTPFLIDWGGDAHPAESAPGGVTVAEFRLSSPDAKQVAAQLEVLGIDVDVEQAGQPGLRAVLAGPGGARLVLGSAGRG